MKKLLRLNCDFFLIINIIKCRPITISAIGILIARVFVVIMGVKKSANAILRGNTLDLFISHAYLILTAAQAVVEVDRRTSFVARQPTVVILGK